MTDRLMLIAGKPTFAACGNIVTPTDSQLFGLHMLKRLLLIAIPCFAVTACGFFPESKFFLSDESRLPKWFSLTAAPSRAQVTVEMAYYVSPLGRTASFILKQRDGKVITEVKGKVRDEHPVYFGPPSADALRRYPSYEVITVNGVSEAIEHRGMEKVFYISDNPVILNKLGEASSNTRATH